MAQPPASAQAPERRSHLAAHPVTSLLIALLLTAAVACTLIVPIYARITPRVGDFPFFYFYLLAFMPVVAIAVWVVTLLERRLSGPRDGAR
jgi:membrane protein implicated in regulation of membrane protease activity